MVDAAAASDAPPDAAPPPKASDAVPSPAAPSLFAHTIDGMGGDLEDLSLKVAALHERLIPLDSSRSKVSASASASAGAGGAGSTAREHRATPSSIPIPDIILKSKRHQHGYGEPKFTTAFGAAAPNFGASPRRHQEPEESAQPKGPKYSACHPCSSEEALLLKAVMQMYSVMERGLQQLSHAAITIELYMLDGTTFEVEVCATGTVADLCEAIEAEKGYAPYLQELTLEGMEESLPAPKTGVKDPNLASSGFGFGLRTGDYEEKLLMSYGI